MSNASKQYNKTNESPETSSQITLLGQLGGFVKNAVEAASSTPQHPLVKRVGNQVSRMIAAGRVFAPRPVSETLGKLQGVVERFVNTEEKSVFVPVDPRVNEAQPEQTQEFLQKNVQVTESLLDKKPVPPLNPTPLEGKNTSPIAKKSVKNTIPTKTQVNKTTNNKQTTKPAAKKTTTAKAKPAAKKTASKTTRTRKTATAKTTAGKTTSTRGKTTTSRTRKKSTSKTATTNKTAAKSARKPAVKKTANTRTKPAVKKTTGTKTKRTSKTEN